MDRLRQAKDDIVHLVSCAAIALVLWIGVACALYTQGVWSASLDDFFRAEFAIMWAARPYFGPADAYWLPLPHYIYGLWYLLVGHHCGVPWYIPVATCLMYLATLANIATTWLLVRSQPRQTRLIALYLATCLPLLIPIAWRMSASALSEPLQLLLQSLMLCAVVVLLSRPSRSAWVVLAIASVGMEMTRYEYWPVVFAIWFIASLAAVGISPKQRVALLFVGASLLSIFPSMWMLYNLARTGDAIHFLAQAREQALVDNPLAEQSLAGRLWSLAGLAVSQAGFLAPLALAWAWLRRHDRPTMILTALGLFVWALYFQPAFANAIGSCLPQRFCLGGWWLVLPLAAAGASQLWSRGFVFRVTVAGLISLGVFLHCCSMDWGKLDDFHLNKTTVSHLKRVRDEVIRNGRVVVLGRDNTSEYLLHVLRAFVQPHPVQLERFYSPAQPARGDFLYVTHNTPLGIRPDGAVLGVRYYRVQSMPPALAR